MVFFLVAGLVFFCCCRKMYVNNVKVQCGNNFAQELVQMEKSYLSNI